MVSTLGLIICRPAMLDCIAKDSDCLRHHLVAFTSLPVNRFPNKAAHNPSNNILKKSSLLFFYFVFNCFANTFYQ